MRKHEETYYVQPEKLCTLTYLVVGVHLQCCSVSIANPRYNPGLQRIQYRTVRRDSTKSYFRPMTYRTQVLLNDSPRVCPLKFDCCAAPKSECRRCHPEDKCSRNHSTRTCLSKTQQTGLTDGSDGLPSLPAIVMMASVENG